MSALTDLLKTVAPTALSAFLGPAGGMVVAGLGKIFGLENATVKEVTTAIAEGNLTPEQIAEIKKLNMQLEADEKERGFRYAELEFKDRDSARQANVSGGTQIMLFWLSLVLLGVCLGMEGVVLFKGYPVDIPEIIVGRVLGLADAVVMMVMSYWYGTSSGSHQKNELLAQSSPASK